MTTDFKRTVVSRLSPAQRKIAVTVRDTVRRWAAGPVNLYGRLVATPINLSRNASKTERCLDIGPGTERIDGFETVNVVWASNVDYVADASRHLPFPDNTFSVVHASHVLEHTPWYGLSRTLAEWIRVLKPGGILEIWVPDGLKLAKFIVDIEEGVQRTEWLDGWRPFNDSENPYLWANGRLLYGAMTDYPSWHLAVITPQFLGALLAQRGLVDIAQMPESEARGTKHGWINLGMRGRKP